MLSLLAYQCLSYELDLWPPKSDHFFLPSRCVWDTLTTRMERMDGPPANIPTQCVWPRLSPLRKRKTCHSCWRAVWDSNWDFNEPRARPLSVSSSASEIKIIALMRRRKTPIMIQSTHLELFYRPHCFVLQNISDYKINQSAIMWNLQLSVPLQLPPSDSYHYHFATWFIEVLPLWGMRGYKQKRCIVSPW